MNASSGDRTTPTALELMLGFAERTGLTSDRSPRRYLWTDAFAVCNLVELGRLELAVKLVGQVHQILGRHRGDDGRVGWLSGLSDAEAARHPTRAGLRIGKALPERRPDEGFDDRLEWERDGQYFHYLTKWMHALDQLARRTGEPKFILWARELAQVAHRAFTFGALDGAGRRMHWKMSIDLSRPLVPSMGQHDPLDGYVSCLRLQLTAQRLGPVDQGPSLSDAAADFRAMITANLSTADPLGIGGLLMDACCLVQLADQGADVDRRLIGRLVAAAEAGLETYLGSADIRQPAAYRLAFRELGLAIGLAGVAVLGDLGSGLTSFAEFSREVLQFWLNPRSQRAPTWLEHQDINEVMLATGLVPDGILRLRT